MQRFPRRWDKITCIDFLQRKIILNCIAYYELNTNKLSDKEYDDLSRQLVNMQADPNIDIINDTQYGYCMYDFDGSTGFDLYYRLNEHDKEYLMSIEQKKKKNDVSIKSKKKRKRGLF